MKTPGFDKKKTDRFSLRQWLPLLIAIGISLGLSALRTTLFPQPRRWHTYVGLGLFLTLILFACANVIFHSLHQKRSSVKILQRFRADLLKRRDSMAHSFARQTQRMEALLWYAYSYYSIVVILVCGVIFCLFDGINEFIIMVYVLWGLLELMFDLDPQELPTQELSETEYPLLHETARNAASTAGYQGQIRIFLGDNSIGVFAMARSESLVLGIPETMLLTQTELTQVLIHEFSHVVQEDTIQSRKIARELEKWNAEKGSSLTRWSKVFLWIPQDILRREFAYYQSLSNIYRELLADAAVAKLGDPQQHINALSKCYAWQLFLQTPRRELIYDLFQTETPRPDYYTYLLEVFQQYLGREEGHWRDIFAREIQLQFDSHPIFRIRAENAGILDYDMHFKETNAAYAQEIHRLLRSCNLAILAGSSREAYNQDRQENYLDRKAIIDEAHAIENFDTVPILLRLGYAIALANIEPGLQKEILESILRQEPDNTQAVWLLAQTLYYEDDDRCIELLYKASRLDNNYFQTAYTLIVSFALQAGRQDLLDDYGERVAEQIQHCRNERR